jgi:preprotein translocase subunit SecE
LLPNLPKIRKSMVFKFFSSFDTGSLKVIWVTYRKLIVGTKPFFLFLKI